MVMEQSPEIIWSRYFLADKQKRTRVPKLYLYSIYNAIEVEIGFAELSLGYFIVVSCASVGIGLRTRKVKGRSRAN